MLACNSANAPRPEESAARSVGAGRARDGCRTPTQRAARMPGAAAEESVTHPTARARPSSSPSPALRSGLTSALPLDRGGVARDGRAGIHPGIRDANVGGRATPPSPCLTGPAASSRSAIRRGGPSYISSCCHCPRVGGGWRSHRNTSAACRLRKPPEQRSPIARGSPLPPPDGRCLALFLLTFPLARGWGPWPFRDPKPETRPFRFCLFPFNLFLGPGVGAVAVPRPEARDPAVPVLPFSF
jgi:hypothetical protein